MVKHHLTRSNLVIAFLSFLGVALTIDFLWAYSPSSSSSMASSWARQKHHLVVLNPQNDAITGTIKVENAYENKSHVHDRELSATFADLPAPELEWEQMKPAPVPRLDGNAIHIKDLLYVFAGFGTLDHVHSHVDVYNFTDNTWGEPFIMPKEMANSHLGMATDGRYIYVVAGQQGPQCRTPPVPFTFVLDTETRKWGSLPPLPAPRYAPATQIWRGRLHVMGGSKENRHTPGTDHWSIAIKNGKALEKEWRVEVPIPRGGPHRSNEVMNRCTVATFENRLLPKDIQLMVKIGPPNKRACVANGDRLFVIGGQEGDFMPKPGSPIYKCSRRIEVVYADVYMLDAKMKWKELSPLPKPNSHIESSWVIVNNSIIIVGGTTEKHPINKRMILVGEVFRFDLNTLEWSIIGKVPYRVKTALVSFWEGWLYFTSGQRDRGPDNPQPKRVLGEMWRTKLSL